MSRKKLDWIELPSRRRRRDYIGLKNRIAAAADRLGGTFLTHDVLDGASWADIYFLSKKRPGAFYNAVIETACCSYGEGLRQKAYDLSYALDPGDELESMFGEPDEKGLAELLPEPAKPAFGGLSRYDWCRAKMGAMAQAGLHPVRESAKIEEGFRYGIGLNIVVAAGVLSVDAVEAFVQEFWGSGELEYERGAPMAFTMEQISGNRLGNSVADPEDWAPSRAGKILAQKEESLLSEAASSGAAARKGPSVPL